MLMILNRIGYLNCDIHHIQYLPQQCEDIFGVGGGIGSVPNRVEGSDEILVIHI